MTSFNNHMVCGLAGNAPDAYGAQKQEVRMRWILLLLAATSMAFGQEYEAKDYSHLIGMKGFGDRTLKNHFTLYEGYVKNTNLLIKILARYAAENRMSTPQFGALQRRLGWEWDGMRLHELYFGNLGGSGKLVRDSDIYQLIAENFGSIESWKADFIATGLMRGIGWVILYRDPVAGRLFNVWINEHDTGHLAGGTPLLVMDVWEHAYMLDYGLDRRAYIEAFFENIDWEVANDRLHTAHGNRPSADEPKGEAGSHAGAAQAG
jgi:superoxide dismutase, Fe-Mn family